MKFTIISLLTVAFLSVGPAGAIPVDNMQDPTTTEAMSRTDDATPAATGATLMSHNLGHNCTDGHAHAHGEHEDVDPATATTAPDSDDGVTAWVKRGLHAAGNPDSTGGTPAGVSSSGSQGSSIPSQSGNGLGSTGQAANWIHGTCTTRQGQPKEGVCHVTMPGDNKETKFNCSSEFPCSYLGSCVVASKFDGTPRLATCS
ncbi:hypothetical protein ABOM_008435 [Aspergillus bombycis]|uniref:Secreted protein n=1 Tax=Aspergillus bombycis TaxID=109264 RepID=A0A1F7ZT61_9EURO|nr:hypothetical protein ABOM_008435 [Aspergillus bombycis]OGM42643.1 hypothetical protein ABOM_008435 [Aspergillus bombycis]